MPLTSFEIRVCLNAWLSNSVMITCLFCNVDQFSYGPIHVLFVSHFSTRCCSALLLLLFKINYQSTCNLSLGFFFLILIFSEAYFVRLWKLIFIGLNDCEM